MAWRGMPSLFPYGELSVMGLAEVVPRIPAILRRIRQTAEHVIEARPDALVTIDSPDFSLRVAARVRRALPGLPVIHYVAPSVWAWRPGRARKMARHVDHVLALLPFEPPFMEAAGMTCDFVGHPAASLPTRAERAAEAAALRAEIFQNRIGARAPGEFARRAARRKMERGAADRARLAESDRRRAATAEAEACAGIRAGLVGSVGARALIAARVEARAAGRVALSPVVLPARVEARRRVSDPLAARVYSSALKISEAMGARWLMRNAAKLALPMLERDATGARRLRSAQQEVSGNGGAEADRGADLSAEVLAVYRHAALQLVPRYLDILAAMIKADGGRVSVDRLAKLRRVFIRALSHRCAGRNRGSFRGRAGAVLYPSLGRGGREVALPWAVDHAAEDPAGEALAVAMGSDGAAGDDTPPDWSRMVPSSDPRTLHSGGVGKRARVEAAAWRAIARGRAEARKRAARAARGGKGAGSVRKGAVAIAATVASVEAALTGRALPDCVARACSAGTDDGISEAWRQRLKTFRDALGIAVPDPVGTASKRFRTARVSNRYASGRAPLRGDAREDRVTADDWSGYAEHVEGAAARPLALVRP
jgi:hypothetical protein